MVLSTIIWLYSDKLLFVHDRHEYNFSNVLTELPPPFLFLLDVVCEQKYQHFEDLDQAPVCHGMQTLMVGQIRACFLPTNRGSNILKFHYRRRARVYIQTSWQAGGRSKASEGRMLSIVLPNQGEGKCLNLIKGAFLPNRKNQGLPRARHKATALKISEQICG